MKINFDMKVDYVAGFIIINLMLYWSVCIFHRSDLEARC